MPATQVSRACPVLVPRLCLGTPYPPGSAWREARRSRVGTAFPGRAWEREIVRQVAAVGHNHVTPAVLLLATRRKETTDQAGSRPAFERASPRRTAGSHACVESPGPGFRPSETGSAPRFRQTPFG